MKKNTPPAAPADKDCQPPDPVVSRYDTVKKILDGAFSKSTADYQGYGKFWLLPRNEFLCLSIYGIRIVAPEQPDNPCDHLSNASVTETARPVSQGSCCHDPSPAPSMSSQPRPTVQTKPGRGAASGLIKALKGLYPYDGTLFPRMPWGADPIRPEDIAFVESWIDDGCPETDVLLTTAASDPNTAARHRGKAPQAQLTKPVNQFNAETGGVKQRKNIESLTDDELCRFRNALQWMHSYDQWPQDDRSFHYWAQIHANGCQHGWEEFLTWHRIYLYLFEQKLQDFDPSVTLPYWDWTLYDQDWNGGATVDNGVIPEAYRCWITQAAIDSLGAQGVPADTLAKLQTVIGKTYNSGTLLFLAAKVPYVSIYSPDPNADPSITTKILNALQGINPLWYRNRWPGGAGGIFEAYPKPQDIDTILKIPNFFNFGSGPDANHFFGALENIHNLMHNFAGGANPNWIATYKGQPVDPQDAQEPQYGDMHNAGVTAFDPIFWAHHANVDRLWSDWQQKNPNVNPDNMDSSLEPWKLTVGDSINISNLGYEYVNTSYVFPVTNTHVPFTAFKTEKAGVDEDVMKNHKSAEIRVHKIQAAMNGGGFIRFFLNEPDANESTPTKTNPNFVSQIALFSGHCVGGPGHCDPPANVSKQGVRRKFDLRSRPHKTPRNIRVDATEAVQRQIAAGKNDLHVSLVVLDVDGSPKQDALKMDAVSLVFLD